MSFKEKLVKECVELINREDIKRQMHVFLSPFINMIFRSFSPYIELLVVFLFLNFIIICLICYKLFFVKN